MSGADLAWALPVVATGYLVLGITGFGSALVIVPLLAWRWPLAEVVPLALLMDVVASALMGRLNWREVRWDVLRALLPGMVAGALLGLGVARLHPGSWPLLALGLYVVWVGRRAWRGVSGSGPASPWIGHLHGLGVGLVQVLFGTAGPLVLAWMARARVPASAVRASTPALMTLVAAAVLLLMAVEGRLSSPALWSRLLWLLPVGVLAVFAGHRLAGRLPVEALRRTIAALLVLSGLALLVNAVRQLG
ncbi:MAG: sulfite exporter TauE/SafE family protein [Burkholderiales bacterium]|nr:MAG: sulfite exporter TauE/SafE family protein [Burkholderiales bacterium]